VHLEQRVEHLERQNRRLRIVGLFVSVLIGLVFLMGQAQGVPEEITAKKFLLMDDDGNYRGVLNVTEHGPVFALLDSNGTYRASLGVGDGTALAIYDEKMNVRAHLSEKLELRNAKGKVIWKAP
jgi:hypothetical protein